MRAHGAQARVCRDVSVIARDLALEIPWSEARYVSPPSEDLYPLYAELEFKTLLARLPAPQSGAQAEPDIPTLRGAYTSFVASVDPPEFVRLAAQLYAN